MPKIIFIEHNGSRHVVDAQPGQSVMAAAVGATIPGILADCGGCCSCATCHAYVEQNIFPEKSAAETEMLECVLEPRASSRLTCQLIVTADMGEIEIQLPEAQV